MTIEHDPSLAAVDCDSTTALETTMPLNDSAHTNEMVGSFAVQRGLQVDLVMQAHNQNCTTNEPTTFIRTGVMLARERRKQRLDPDSEPEDLFESHKEITRSIVRKFMNFKEGNVHLDDMQQVAEIGLFKAVSKFDPEKGRFIDYAWSTIMGEVKRYLRDSSWTIRPPREARDTYWQVRDYFDSEMTSEQKEAYANSRGVSVEQLDRMVIISYIRRMRSIGTDVESADHDTMKVAGKYDEQYPIMELWHLIDTMFKHEPVVSRILRLKCEGYTQDEIASMTGSYQKEVSRILQRAKTRLALHVDQKAS